MKRFLRWLKMLIGPCRVLYPDGEWSMIMDYGTARGYARMFGGDVHPASDMKD